MDKIKYENLRRSLTSERKLLVGDLREVGPRFPDSGNKDEWNPSTEDLDRLRAAIEEIGKDAPAKQIIDNASIRKSDALRILRHLQQTGEYTGFRRSQRRTT